MKKWKLNNWKNYPVKHIPEYEDQKELDLVLKKILGCLSVNGVGTVWLGIDSHLINIFALMQ